MIGYRQMQQVDIAECLRLCREANWNQLERDWQIFLRLSPQACLVATAGEKVTGTVTTISYQHLFSWIGMVLVDPANRRQGIGSGLLKQALQVLQDEETIKLDATPEGRNVYLKLNFVDEYKLSRMMAVAAADKVSGTTARPVYKSDLSALAAFDREIFGASRSALLRWVWEGAPRLAFMEEAQNQIQGYCLARPGHNFTHIGPVVANNLYVAQNLVSAALYQCNGQPVILDALHFNPAWHNWLANAGFTRQRSFTRMYRGSNLYPGTPEKQFAILGPEFG